MLCSCNIKKYHTLEGPSKSQSWLVEGSFSKSSNQCIDRILGCSIFQNFHKDQRDMLLTLTISSLAIKKMSNRGPRGLFTKEHWSLLAPRSFLWQHNAFPSNLHFNERIQNKMDVSQNLQSSNANISYALSIPLSSNKLVLGHILFVKYMRESFSELLRSTSVFLLILIPVFLTYYNSA